jgi:hypothetical protein
MRGTFENDEAKKFKISFTTVTSFKDYNKLIYP